MSAPRSMVPFGGIHSPAPGLLNLGLPAWLRSGPGAPQCPRVLSLGSSHISMDSGALSQSLPEFSGELSTHLGSGAGAAGRVAFRRPHGRGSQPPSRRRNIAGVCEERPQVQDHFWTLHGPPLEGRLCSGLQQVIGDAAYSEFIKGPPFPRTVMQRPAWLSFFSVRGKKETPPADFSLRASPGLGHPHRIL